MSVSQPADIGAVDVYSDVVKDGDVPAMSHLVVANDHRIVGVGAAPVPAATTSNEARRQALRDGLSAAATVGTPDTLTVCNVNVRHSGLVFGRLPTELRAWLDDIQTVTLSAETAPVGSVATGLARQVNRQPFSPAFTTPTDGQIENPVRIYVDGSHREQVPSTAIGYAIVDAAGRIVALRAAGLSEPRSPLEAEYRAAVRALQWARDCPALTDAHVITDNMNVQQTVEDNMAADVPSPPRVRSDARRLNLLRRGFDSFRIEHQSRSQNQLADSLAWCGHTRVLWSTPPRQHDCQELSRQP